MIDLYDVIFLKSFLSFSLRKLGVRLPSFLIHEYDVGVKPMFI